MKAKTLRSYRFDDKTLSVISEMKKELGLDNSATVKRALTILKLVSDSGKDGSKVIIESSNGERTLIVL